MPSIPFAALAVLVAAVLPIAAAEPGAEPARPGTAAEDLASSFALRIDGGAITSLRRIGDLHETDYVHPGARFGDLIVRWRAGGGEWREVSTGDFATAGKLGPVPAAAGRAGGMILDGAAGPDGAGPGIATAFDFRGGRLIWTISLWNPTEGPLEIGGLAFPCPMNTEYVWDRETTYRRRVIRHASIAGGASFIYWARPDATPPYLLFAPFSGTSLEYFDTAPRRGGPRSPFTAYIHSASERDLLAAKGTRWRQAHTSAVLAPRGAPGDSASYGFALEWADGIDDIRRRLVEGGGLDMRVVPGMTVPSGLEARIALRAKGGIGSLEAEHPEVTEIRPLPSPEPGTCLFSVRFGRLGENLLSVRWGDGRKAPLEFFAAEPLETLVRKRARFLARSQHRDPSKWYDGLIADWNMRDRVLLSPDDLSTVPESRRYMVTCDDPGLAKPAFLAAKNAEFPEWDEVEALDRYIGKFLWGGLQMTEAESHPFGIYGIQDWKRNRESPDPGPKGRLHIWRIYDYPHVVMLWLHRARIAERYPEIPSPLPADEYLRRAHGTAMAFFRYPLEIEKWSPYETGTYDEVVIEDLLEDLARRGWTDRERELRRHWNRKVEFFVGGKANLFGSEYPFDSTGFESTHAFARHALRGSGRGGPAAGGPDVTQEAALRFSEEQIRLNVGCRGWLEPSYWILGSDIRGGGSARYTLSYMTPMGGWAILDHALHDAPDPHRLLPLGYASILASWALLNSGPAEAGHGFWFPGPESDGAAGGGFEPAPYGMTWLGQPHSRGAWSYACESDLGFGGYLRAAATVLALDPLFGAYAYGGSAERDGDRWKVLCRDGVRRRFHAVLGPRRIRIELDRDHFAADVPITLDDPPRRIYFALESPTAAPHRTGLRLGLPAGGWRILVDGTLAADLAATAGGEEVRAEIPVAPPRTSVTLEVR